MTIAGKLDSCAGSFLRVSEMESTLDVLGGCTIQEYPMDEAQYQRQ